MISPASDPIGIEAAELLAALQYDYVELSLAHLAALNAAEFTAVQTRLKTLGIPCEACNNFFPPAIRLTGPDAKLDAAIEYAERALGRAAAIGAKIVVFGSSGAKNIPAGFSEDEAWKQVVDLLKHIGPIAQHHGIQIAIESINREEANFITLSEHGLRLMQEVDDPAVGMVLDVYHLQMEQENPRVIIKAGEGIVHLHIAQLDGRRFPSDLDPAWPYIFDCLHDIDYRGRCSIEAYTDDLMTDARRAKTFFRNQLESMETWSR